jgi:hypothetical protein
MGSIKDQGKTQRGGRNQNFLKQGQSVQPFQEREYSTTIKLE